MEVPVEFLSFLIFDVGVKPCIKVGGTGFAHCFGFPYPLDLLVQVIDALLNPRSLKFGLLNLSG